MTELTPADLQTFLPRLHNSPQRTVIAVHDDSPKYAANWFEFVEQLAGQQSAANKTLIVSDCIAPIDAGKVPGSANSTIQQFSAKKVKRLLGDEYECALFDARENLDLDALGVVSGLIRGGGCLLLLLPKLSVWQTKSTAFYSHLRGMLSKQPGVFYVQNTADLKQTVSFPTEIIETQLQYLPCKTFDQHLLLEELFAAVTQQARLCHVLISGRGRGKSSLLGLLAAKLLKQMTIKIIIMAPARSTADPFFYHLMQQCECAETARSVVRYGESKVMYMAPDAMLDSLSGNEQQRADLLLIDEAAAIPQSMLALLLKHYDKLIFSTTTHGYEGTGRGFVLKFFKLLDQIRPEWKKSELHQPVRWQQHDWLEQWIEQLLFLDLQVDQSLPGNVSRSDLQVEQLDPAELVKDQKKLQVVFSLLVGAHYRTRPSDFAYLLDSEDVRLYVLRLNSMIVAVLAINQEGSFSPELSTQVYRGMRRPKGHLLAQTLCFHGGIETAAQLNYARIMRIAVHPAMQRMGLGRYLVNSVIQLESSRGMDVIGCSFSAEASLLAFWHATGFSVLRIGFSRDHVSASHAIVMGCALSDTGQLLFNRLQDRLGRNLSDWLNIFLVDMQSDVKQALYELLADHVDHQSVDDFTVSDLEDVVSFAEYRRNYAACWPAISRMIKHYKTLVNELSHNEKMMLTSCVEHANDWPAMVKINALLGRGEAEQRMRNSLQHLLAIYFQKKNI